MGVKNIISDAKTLARMPVVVVNLMHGATAGNDPFYSRVVRDFFAETQKRHPKFPLAKQYEYGMALCMFPKDFEAYFAMIEGAARRNFRKAERLGYRFERIEYNRYLDDVHEIRRSTDVRQGRMPASLLEEEVAPCSNPPSNTNVHDYPFFGVLKDGKLAAYADCLVSGEVCMIEHMLGHAKYQGDGIVPMLIISMAGYAMKTYPNVRYYTYGTYFGAAETMRRFKRKFGFSPCRVKWVLT
jgi:hypothetical protein